MIKYRQYIDGKMIHSGFESCGSFVMPNVNIFLYPIMRYTGIKDKNGIEIYEGDVIRTTSAKGVVVFSQGSFIIEWGDYEIIAGEIRRCVYIPAWFDGIYVIGNIHENKDLL